MAKYDVELITDKHGKPMPQYFDEVEKKMKPITKDNFDGTINGSVDVEFPDVQKVEVTNPTDFPADLNVNVNNPVDTVSVDNLPDVQRVEVTNAQEQLDVNVLNPVDNVSVNNLPTDYPDQAVEARLQAIEQTQSQILDKLNDSIDTRLTGSILEDAIPTESIGRKVEHVELLERAIRYPSTSGGEDLRYSSVILDVPIQARKILFKCNVYGLIGDFASGEGYRFDLRNVPRNGVYSEIIFTMDYKTHTANNSGATYELGEGVSTYSSSGGSYAGKSNAPLSQVRLLTWLKGKVDQSAGEGIDYSVDAYIYY